MRFDRNGRKFFPLSRHGAILALLLLTAAVSSAQPRTTRPQFFRNRSRIKPLPRKPPQDKLTNSKKIKPSNQPQRNPNYVTAAG
jgi:hypothetical protein